MFRIKTLKQKTLKNLGLRFEFQWKGEVRWGLSRETANLQGSAGWAEGTHVCMCARVHVCVWSLPQEDLPGPWLMAAPPP